MPVSVEKRELQSVSHGFCAGECLGMFAISLAGHDSGDIFIVVGTDLDGYVLLSDGKRRNIFHPKRKKLKHVRFLEGRSASIAEALTSGRPVDDAWIRRALKEFSALT